MNTKIPMRPASELGLGVVVRIKSHNARHNAQRVAPSLRSLLSLKWAWNGKRHAADGFYSVTPDDAGKLMAATGRWSRSVAFPKRVPADLDFNRGGIFG